MSEYNILGYKPCRRERRLEILRTLSFKQAPVSPRDVGAKASDQTTSDLQHLEKYGMVKTVKHPHHPYFRLYAITKKGRKFVWQPELKTRARQ